MRPVLVVMPWEFYESLVETLDVLSDPEMASRPVSWCTVVSRRMTAIR